MKKIPLLFIIIILIIIVCQPFFISLFTNNQILITISSSLVYFFIAYPVFLIYKNFNKDANERENSLLQNAHVYKEELGVLKASISHKYIFYKHNPDEAFAWISDSVFNILGVSSSRFKDDFAHYLNEDLFDGAFDRVKEAAENGIQVPLREITIKGLNKQVFKFELREIPLYNYKKEIISVWGTLHKVKEKKIISPEICKSRDVKFNLLFENINEGVLIIKGDRFVDCNRKALALFETSKEQMLMYSPFLRKFSPEIQPSGKSSKEEALRNIKLAYEGENQRFIWQHLKNYKNPFMVEIKLSRFEWETEYYLMAVLVDLSFKEKCNLEIQDKDKLLSILLENHNNGVAIVVDEKIEKTNCELESITQYSSKELISFESLFVLAADLEKVRLSQVYTEIVSGKSDVNELDYWFKRKDGSYIYIKNRFYSTNNNMKNRYILTSDITKKIVADYKQNPTEDKRKELEIYVPDL